MERTALRRPLGSPTPASSTVSDSTQRRWDLRSRGKKKSAAKYPCAKSDLPLRTYPATSHPWLPPATRSVVSPHVTLPPCQHAHLATFAAFGLVSIPRSKATA